MSIVLFGIAARPVNKADMQTFPRAQIVETGLAGNYYADHDKRMRSSRQVTVLSLEQWIEAIKCVGEDLPWWLRRANLCIRGYSFTAKDVGRSILIGRNALLHITGETDPCKRMDEIFPGLQNALGVPFRGGVTCRVTNPGEIFLNDIVHTI